MTGLSARLKRDPRRSHGPLTEALAHVPAPFSNGTVRLSPDGAGYLVAGPGGATLAHLDPAAPDRKVVRTVKRARAVYLDLDEASLIAVTATLPAAASEDVREAVALRMAELTPFTEDEVIFDTGAPRALGPDRIAVPVYAVPRNILKAHGTALAALGIGLDGATSSAAVPDEAPFLPDFAPETRRRRARRNAWLLAGGLLILAAGAAALSHVEGERQQTQIAQLRAAVSTLRDEMLQAQALDDDIARLSARLRAPAERRAGEISPLMLLDAVAAALPDEAYLTDARWTGAEITLRGLAQDASALLAPLEASPLLSDVRLSAPISRDPGQALERFSISAQIGVRGERP
ncbi:PilN domain-containing protein [Futiania mangrovi]|uniref:PilN domain-containing protein n=1 Tax=Futiania mangrovi TaxID=2959716 RepID=A0A9J6PCD5_9PROT|nr:PilN domain-containing protein [Futiania mangrovii]MCP1337876.1 PilN domain-containing protein [Futiania mangrovii]